MKIPLQNKKKLAAQTAILRFLYAGGILTAALVAPKLLSLLGPADRSQPRRKALYARLFLARRRLLQRGLIYLDENESGSFVHLTPKGEKSIEKILAREYRIPEQVWWDGKWRVLIFDIKEKRRRIRSTLRQLLAGVGFVRLQDSVWVYPYPCDEFVAIVRAHLSSGVGELRSLVVEALESDKQLREHFSLLI
ncbi:CRISPR-associated endonuclease Cas2 [Candidatus Kaiserbacteria bacterium]|nr:CRISPR-associated endonuclease Cas2 [Candidatus Kaiserbacteria bacterium]